MSKKFHAENIITKERWKPNDIYGHQYLVMYDTGFLAVVTETTFDNNLIKPLDRKIWRVIQNE